MNREQFWDLIEQTRPTDPDLEPYDRNIAHADSLDDHLTERTAEEVIGFAVQLDELQQAIHSAAMLEVLYILTGGGPGDESFSAFNTWLILQGREVFEAIVRHPETLPERYPPGSDIYTERSLGAIAPAWFDDHDRTDFDQQYEAAGGTFGRPTLAEEPTDDEDELRRKYPQLWENYYAAYD